MVLFSTKCRTHLHSEGAVEMGLVFNISWKWSLKLCTCDVQLGPGNSRICSKTWAAGDLKRTDRKCLSLLHFGLLPQKDVCSLWLLSCASCSALLGSGRRSEPFSVGCLPLHIAVMSSVCGMWWVCAPVQLRHGDFLVIVGKGKTALGFPLLECLVRCDKVNLWQSSVCCLLVRFLWVMDNVFRKIYLCAIPLKWESGKEHNQEGRCFISVGHLTRLK